MNKLPFDIAYNILEFSGHGTVRNGYRRYDGSIEPCKFIFKLAPKRLDLCIKPILDGKVTLQISPVKLIEISVSTLYKFEISIWNDPYRYLTRGVDFCWDIMEAPTRSIVFREYFR